MLNASQKRMNRAALIEALLSSTPASTAGWLATIADREAAEMRETADDVRREIAVYLVEVAIVHHAPEDLVHVVRLVGRVRHEIEQRLFPAVPRIG